MKYAFYLLLISLPGCHSGEGIPGPERFEFAFINDSSYFVDGCELFIQLDTGSLSIPAIQYKPTPGTEPIAKQAIPKLTTNQNGDTRVPIKIRFVETGKQVVIHCGWSNSTVSEIKILEITPR